MEIAQGATQSFVIDDGNTIYLRTAGVADYVIMPFGSTANQVTGSINSTQGVVNLGPIYNQSVVRITATNGSCEYSNDLIESPAVVGTVNDSHELSDVVRAVNNPVTGGITKIWTGTQAQYDAIATPADDTLYIIVEA